MYAMSGICLFLAQYIRSLNPKQIIYYSCNLGPSAIWELLTTVVTYCPRAYVTTVPIMPIWSRGKPGLQLICCQFQESIYQVLLETLRISYYCTLLLLSQSILLTK